MNTTALNALAGVLASIARRLLSTTKPGISDLLGLIINDGGDIRTAIQHIKEVPAEFLDIDADEGQELAAMVKVKLGEVADTTNLDEILGEIFVLVPRVKLNWELIAESQSWESKGESIGHLLTYGGRLFDLIHPPKETIIMEEEDVKA